MLIKHPFKFALAAILAAIILSACVPGRQASPAPTTANPPAGTLTPTSPVLTNTPVPSATPSPTLTPSHTPSPSPTATASPTPVPTYVKLRGKVMVDQAVCHYGPGQPYLYKYAVIGGSNLEIIGRVEDVGYLKVQAIGGNNPCWVNQKWMEVKGDLANVQPVDPETSPLPRSPYYSALDFASATRNGNQVTAFWGPMILRPGDDSEQYLYLLEAWVCQNGRLVFTPVGTYQTSHTLTDEPGCASPSHARIYGVEKHGYTRWRNVPWPPFEGATPTPSP